ncbi:MAG: winged helix-turn-helix domain-containing protein [Prevotellaceae bacterium]|jgi:DNA-binding response OmpR family regulator|nr:winged helix-turn-helix domain-containing protein [Prevotellaceae bacterium]
MEINETAIDKILNYTPAYKQKMLDRMADVHQIGQLTFDARTQTLKSDTQTTPLTKTETKLLRLLCLHANEVIQRRVLLQHVWQSNDLSMLRTLHTYINRLRKYFRADPSVRIDAIVGTGFRLVVPETD